MKRHWSFIVCDKKYLYPLSLILVVMGTFAAIHYKDATQISRIGNFIVGIGVWMSMRGTFREGINKHKDANDSSPVFPGTNQYGTVQVNPNYFNKITFSIGDAQLQIHGFVLVIFGSVVGSYGDLIITFIVPQFFNS